MNLMKNVMGVVARGNSKKTIYFCRYSHSEYEHVKIKKLLESIAFHARLRGNDVRILAIESSDEMVSDIKLIGITYRVMEGNSFFYKTAILDQYRDLSMCFDDMNEML